MGKKQQQQKILANFRKDSVQIHYIQEKPVWYFLHSESNVSNSPFYLSIQNKILDGLSLGGI